MAKAFLKWYYTARQVKVIQWKGTLGMLRAMTKLEQQNAIPVVIRNLWKEGEDLKELLKSLFFFFFFFFIFK